VRVQNRDENYDIVIDIGHLVAWYVDLFVISESFSIVCCAHCAMSGDVLVENFGTFFSAILIVCDEVDKWN